jgi:hypothetical protein
MDWEETQNVQRAKQFITAASRLLALRPASSSFKSSAMSYDLSAIQEMIRRARAFAQVAEPFTSRGHTKILGVGQGFRG